jgi:phosphatidylserine decarboxylase
MLTARSWAAARPYVLPPLAAGLALAPARPRLGIPLIAAACAAAAFFRDPDRPATPTGGDVLYAPADGTVTAAGDSEAEGLVISTYLSLADVHVARSPAAGTLASWDERDGRHSPARSPRAHRNRQARLEIRSSCGTPITVRLITGAIARRISQWAQPGEPLESGQRLGIIHFGSRTDVITPAGTFEALVRPGDRVAAGITPIARILRHPAPPSAGLPPAPWERRRDRR